MVRVSGGGARSRLWLEILATVLGRPIEQVAVPEAAALGAALLGGVAGGVWNSVEEAIASQAAVTETIEPVPAWSDAYEVALACYRQLYPFLAGWRRATEACRHATVDSRADRD